MVGEIYDQLHELRKLLDHVEHLTAEQSPLSSSWRTSDGGHGVGTISRPTEVAALDPSRRLVERLAKHAVSDLVRAQKQIATAVNRMKDAARG